jgi:hypothetical protein
MVLQCAIQMIDIRKTLKNCQMKIAYLFSPMSRWSEVQKIPCRMDNGIYCLSLALKLTQGYIHNIKISEARGAIRVDARCWRSMRKSQDPHNLHVEIGDDKLSESYCTDLKSGKNETAILSGIFSKESDASLGC